MPRHLISDAHEWIGRDSKQFEAFELIKDNSILYINMNKKILYFIKIK